MREPQAATGARSNGSVAFLSGCFGGAFVWLWFGGFDFRREGWDNPHYFTIGVPVLLALCAILGFIVPLRAWRWGVASMLGQVVVAIAGNPTLNMLPLGLAIFAALAAPCAGAAVLGGLLRRKVGPRESA